MDKLVKTCKPEHFQNNMLNNKCFYITALLNLCYTIKYIYVR